MAFDTGLLVRSSAEVRRGPGGSGVVVSRWRVLPPPDSRRGVIRGLSLQAANRQTKFLQSVDVDRLTGHGYAFTFTVRDCPASHEHWAKARRLLLKSMRERWGAVRWHWVTENAQVARGGVPHAHWAVYFERPLSARDRFFIVERWLAIAGRWGAKRRGQHIDVIQPGRGWDRYCAKHAARTVGHYQRQGLPGSWEKSGRVWGRGGDWPVRVDRWLLSPAALVQVRRLVRSWLVADARISAARLRRFDEQTGRVRRSPWRGVRAARRVLRSSPDEHWLRSMRVWIPEAVMWRLMHLVGTMPGCYVAEIVEAADRRADAREALGLAAPQSARDWDLRDIALEVGPVHGPPTQRQARIDQLRTVLGARYGS